jgi:3-oxoacyl-[acyl-carrier protein] reductase
MAAQGTWLLGGSKREVNHHADRRHVQRTIETNLDPKEHMSTNVTKKLAGKVALVTGGSRGIGAAIVKRLAAEGADVAFSYVTSADKANALVRELEDQGVKIAAFRADRADTVQITQLVKYIVEKFGRLDILVNNAGVFVSGAVNDPTYDATKFDRQFAINVGGVAAAVRAAAPFLGEGGRIISIGSGAGANAPWPGIADYAASKAAVAVYTRGWARDFGSHGITVNVSTPGGSGRCRAGSQDHQRPVWSARELRHGPLPCMV